MAEHPCHVGTFQYVRHPYSHSAGRSICPGEQVTIRDEFGGSESGELLPFRGEFYRIRRDDGTESLTDWHVFRSIEPRVS